LQHVLQKILSVGVLLAIGVSRIAAQDDVTTRHGSSDYDGSFISGPASNPLSFLNGPAYRTFGSNAPYDLPDFKPASLLNQALPRWIQFGVEARLRWEGYQNGTFKANNSDYYLLNRFRFQMTLKPTSWLKFVSQVQDARPFFQKPPYGPPNENTWDLKLAYVEFGDPETQWFSLRVGRQIINYNNTLIANSEWRNQARSYDAAVANLHYDRFRAGIFAASVVDPLIEGISHHQEGNNIYGIYGGIDRLLRDSVLEPFILWRVAPSVGAETTAEIKSGRLSEKAAGFRWKGQAIRDLDYSFEAVWERGSAGKSEIQAAATSFGAAYRVSKSSWKPRFFSQYDYASGDKSPSGTVRQTFDTMYPTAHDRFGISDQFGWQNIEAGRAGITIEPRRRWTVTAQYLHFWLASATDALYNTSGAAIVRDATGRSGRDIGGEVDAYTWYELNRHVNIGVGVGHILPGNFLENATKGPNYTAPYFAINFKDDGKSK
jgi:hypothetical protein